MSSAPPAPGVANSTTQQLANLSVEPGGVLQSLWITVFILGNIYAAYWLLRAFLNAHPEKRDSLRRALRFGRSRGPPGAAAGPLSRIPDTAPNGVSRDSTLATEYVFPVLLEWRDLGTKVTSAMGSKMILQGVTGAVAPGEMQALIGPSGAGKSTLMDRLAMRDSSGKAGGGGSSVRTGHVLVNGQPRTQVFFRLSTYVPQSDNLVPTMTCEESLAFYAAVILPPSTSKVEQRQRIQDALKLVGLQDKGAALVGGVLPGGLMLRGLSGGERKRLAIAAGVVANPSLVFLDEPTSGLDSQSALQVMEMMKKAALRGHTMVASVHQPRTAIWNLFDSVTLLSKGRLMYHGPTAHMVTWFSVLGYSYDPAAQGSASDWVLDLVSLGFDKRTDPATGVANITSASSNLVSSDGNIAEDSGELERAGSLEQVQNMVARKVTADALANTMGTLEELDKSAEAFTYCQRALLPQWYGGGLLGAGATSTNSLRSLQGSHNGSTRSAAVKPRGGSRWFGFLGHKTPAEAALADKAAIPLDDMLAGASAGGAVADSRSEELVQQFTAAGGRLQVPAAAAVTRHMYSQLPAGSHTGAPSASILISGKTEQPARKDAAADAARMERPSSSDTNDTNSPTAASLPPTEGDAASLALWQQQQQRQPAAARGLTFRLHQFWVHFKALAWRDYLMTTRNPADVAGRMLTFTYVAILNGIIMWNLPADSSSIERRMQVCYAGLSFYMLLPFVFMSLFGSDKRFYMADAASKIYQPRAYYPAKFVAGLPFNISVALAFHLIYYGMSGLRHSALAVLASSAIAVLMSLIAMQVVYCCAVVAGSQDLAFVYAIAWTSLNLLINPFMQVYQNFQMQWLTYLQYVSASSFAWQGMAQVELANRGFNCSKGGGFDAFGIYTDTIPRNGTLGIIGSRMGDLGADCIADGNVVLEYYGASRPFAATLGILFAYLAVVHLITYIALWRVSSKLAVKK